MADMNERDSKLVQYLSEAYGKEKELETALQAHILMTAKGPYRKRLQQHLKETKAHAREVERRIKKLGGGGQILQTAVGRVTAVAKGPLHVIRGSGEQEKMLKNAKTEYFNEHEEIATYLAIETLAERVWDKETAKLARTIRREEERMARYLEGQIKTLTRAVAAAEVPASQRRRPSPARGKRKPSAAKAKASTAGSRGRSSTGRRPKAKGAGKAGGKRRAAARS